jgi:hypothetical protein
MIYTPHGHSAGLEWIVLAGLEASVSSTAETL